MYSRFSAIAAVLLTSSLIAPDLAWTGYISDPLTAPSNGAGPMVVKARFAPSDQAATTSSSARGTR